MMKKFLQIAITSILISTGFFSVAHSAGEDIGFTKLTVVDLNTFNEYKYRITEQFFALRNKHDLTGKVDQTIALNIAKYAESGYDYLPDNLANQNLLQLLKTALAKGIKYPDNDANYTAIIQAIGNYLDTSKIESIKGRVEATPSEGNAPLTVTLRGRVTDPTGTTIPSYNYTWWIDNAGKREVIGRKTSLNYTFKEEGNFSVFLDVTSNHRNEKGNIDVLPFRSRADIKVKEKIASIIIKVNSDQLRQKDELKFTPQEARHGLIFDATSSTPTSGSKFTSTSWDFGNGIERTYDGNPKVERVVFTREGDYTVKLKLRTNESKIVERQFVVRVHDPISTIRSSLNDGFLGDTFTFSAQNSGNDENLSYVWEIVDIDKDNVIFKKSGSLITYNFTKKGKFNIKLYVTEPGGDTDIDTKIIHINSRPPVAHFKSTIPFSNKPNTVLLNATKSYDPDFSDDGKLEYSWIINGERVTLEDPNYNGSVGYYTFDSIGDQSVVLEVIDPDGISAQEKGKVRISSLLAVDFFPFPRVVTRGQVVRFVAESPKARFYEWDFGDGDRQGGKDGKITHTYDKSGIYAVKLRVRDDEDRENQITKNVYVGETDTPYAFLGVRKSLSSNEVSYRNDACSGNPAYIINRVSPVVFSAAESIDITGKNTGLSYSWKLGRDTFYSTREFTQKFDEIGCFPVKLTVKSNKNGRTHSTETWVKVENEAPVLSSLDVRITDITTDPVVVKVQALGAKDPDGVIQSYLWYYYTDLDPEPQDFRATSTDSTTFVLPKVTGNYYFVVVMKDNNELRVNSEEITGSKYFITLSGDNINTPLVDLSVNDSTIAIGEEVVFSARVENILGSDLSKKASYYWDFDGDGFYDTESSSSSVTHQYDVSGEFHAKVKAKYKGFSNTKTVTINVENKLTPDFSYISIGNTFVFMDTSAGTYSDTKWTIDPDTIFTKAGTVTHEYTDAGSSHVVELQISEGTKSETTQKKVVKNPKNILKVRKGGLVVFTNPEQDERGAITLDTPSEKVWIYLGASSNKTGKISSYSVDFDIEKDSDLNGGKDDDEDNKGSSSYSSGDSILVTLNDKKIQKVRAVIRDESGDIIDSTDIEIVKSYITESDINLDTIKFEGLTDSQRAKIEKLKAYVGEFPKEYKLHATQYLQKLQDEWSDTRERANIILEFEGFLGESNLAQADDMITLLESIFVEGEDDKSEKAITFNALKALLPVTITCTSDTGEVSKCYENLVEKLEIIRGSDNLDENRVLGKEILKAVEVDTQMSQKQKIDFKAILKTLVYGGVKYIPEEEIASPEDEVDAGDTEGNSVLDLLGTILYFVLLICGVFALLVFLYWIYYKVMNKNDDIGFQDFIIDKTSGGQMPKEQKNDDVLGVLASEKITEKKETVTSEVKAETKTQVISNPLATDTVKATGNAKKEEVPSWLAGAGTPVAEKKETPVEKKAESTQKKSDEAIPSWLAGTENKASNNEQKKAPTKVVLKNKENNEKIEKVVTKTTPVVEKKEANSTPKKTDIKTSEKKLDDVTKVEEAKVPDWLKGSFDETSDAEAKKTTKKSEDKIPDWLKGSFDETPSAKKEESKTESKSEVKTEVKTTEKSIEKKEEVKKTPVKTEEKPLDKTIEQEKVTTTEQKDTAQKEKSTKKEVVKTPETKKTTQKKDAGEKTEDSLAKKAKEAPENKAKSKVEKKKTQEKTPKKTESKTEAVVEKKKESTEKKVASGKDSSDSKEKVAPKKVKTDDTKKTEKSEKNQSAELWDDGMKIPDWLKTGDDDK